MKKNVLLVGVTGFISMFCVSIVQVLAETATSTQETATSTIQFLTLKDISYISGFTYGEIIISTLLLFILVILFASFLWSLTKELILKK